MAGNTTISADKRSPTIEPLVDRFLMKIAEKLGSNTMELGIALGLSSIQVKQIIHDERCIVSVNFAILAGWRMGSQHQDDPSTMRMELRNALSDIGRKDLVVLV